MTEFKQHTKYIAGFDKRDEKPNYGINGGVFLFVLSGPLGAVDFTFSPSFFPEKTRQWLIQCSRGDPMALIDSYSPTGYSVGFHSPTSTYEGQEMSTGCEFIEGGNCYVGASYSMSDDVLKGFISGGTEWLWARLEEIYKDEFEKEKT